VPQFTRRIVVPGQYFLRVSAKMPAALFLLYSAANCKPGVSALTNDGLAGADFLLSPRSAGDDSAVQCIAPARF